jgi:hypothetical protein
MGPLKYIVKEVVNVDHDTGPLSKVAMVKPYLLSGEDKGGTSKLRMRMGNIYNRACLMRLSGVLEMPIGNANMETGYAPAISYIVIRDLGRCRV